MLVVVHFTYINVGVILKFEKKYYLYPLLEKIANLEDKMVHRLNQHNFLTTEPILINEHLFS